MNEATANNTPTFGVTTETPANDMSMFFTRESANEGIKVSLLDPKGEKTDHFLVLRGSRSDAMTKAREEMQRRMLDKDADRMDLIRALLASSVKSWSFKAECTLENVKNFLREAPQIADQIERAIYNDSNFTKG